MFAEFEPDGLLRYQLGQTLGGVLGLVAAGPVKAHSIDGCHPRVTYTLTFTIVFNEDERYEIEINPVVKPNGETVQIG